MLKQLTIWAIIIVPLSYNNLVLATTPTEPPTVVDVITVHPGAHQNQITATGSLISVPGIVVKSEIAGRITKILFNSGEVVTAGTPLIEINPELIKPQLAQAQAQAQFTKLQFERATKLYKTNDVSKDHLDQAQANYNTTQAQVELVQAQLRRANIVAPFAGKLGLSQVHLGDYVNAGQNIVNLQTVDPLRVDFSISEAYISKVAVGQAVLLHTDAYPQKTFTGKIEAIESLINSNNRTLNIRAIVPNKSGELIPGAFVEVTIQLGLQQQIIAIPQTSIVYAPEANYVFKAVNGKAVKEKVILGERDSNNIIVKSGIKDGDVIITAGQLKLHEGSPIVVL